MYELSLFNTVVAAAVVFLIVKSVIAILISALDKSFLPAIVIIKSSIAPADVTLYVKLNDEIDLNKLSVKLFNNVVAVVDNLFAVYVFEPSAFVYFLQLEDSTTTPPIAFKIEPKEDVSVPLPNKPSGKLARSSLRLRPNADNKPSKFPPLFLLPKIRVSNVQLLPPELATPLMIPKIFLIGLSDKNGRSSANTPWSNVENSLFQYASKLTLKLSFWTLR